MFRDGGAKFSGVGFGSFYKVRGQGRGNSYIQPSGSDAQKALDGDATLGKLVRCKVNRLRGFACRRQKLSWISAFAPKHPPSSFVEQVVSSCKV